MWRYRSPVSAAAAAAVLDAGPEREREPGPVAEAAVVSPALAAVEIVAAGVDVELDEVADVVVRGCPLPHLLAAAVVVEAARHIGEG